MDKFFSEDGRLWERQAGETPKQFSWFKAYRSLPAVDRTVVEAYRRKTGKLDLVKAPSWIYELSSQMNWRRRAAEFDAYLDRLQYEADIDERMKARRLRRAVLLSAIKKAGEALPKIDLTNASASELARLLDVTSRNLREEYSDLAETRQTVTLVNGGTTEHVQLADRADSMTDAELVAEYRRLTSAATARPLTNGRAGSDEEGSDAGGTSTT